MSDRESTDRARESRTNQAGVLARHLTSREMARVSREVAARYPRDTQRTRDEYQRLMWETASELYPHKLPA